jgi:hypothetical protein
MGWEYYIYIKASVFQWKDIHPRRPEFGPEGMHIVSGNSRFLYFLGSSEASMGREGARSAPFGVLESSKRGVRAAHGRARAAKTH